MDFSLRRKHRVGVFVLATPESFHVASARNFAIIDFSEDLRVIEKVVFGLISFKSKTKLVWKAIRIKKPETLNGTLIADWKDLRANILTFKIVFN